MGGMVFGRFDHRMPRSARSALAALLLGLFVACPAAAVESWSDPNLKVQDGLELWLDAGRATGEEPLPADGLLSAWRDASGRGRHVSQSSAEAQPKRIVVGDSAIVRFDGVNDHLRAIGQATKLESFTLFLVAAPWQNVGTWRGLVAFNAPNERDYASGLNVDLGSEPSAKFSTLNVEGRGFQGMQNLRSQESSFGPLKTLVIASDNAAKSLRLAVDGESEGERSRSGEPISMEEITIGARHFSAFDGKVQPNGFGREDIAEVLVFNRLLSEQEIDEVQKYLDAKYSAVKDSITPPDDETAEQLVPIENPPAVQMFAPGFAVRELPIDLTNINNVKYRPDGTLVALGYDGRVWLLRDTNDDGLEDEAEIFWDNPIGLRSTIGMDLTPPDYEHGEGLFVVGKTECLLIVDTDQDGRADKEVEIAGGWKEGFTLVDGLGVAFDKRDNSIYYGRATYNFMAPLLPDKAGNPEYSVSSEGGAIHRISPDFKSREVVASGIRVPVGLRINRHGDLFASDQEGATWVPNGNPFDELLHIQKGRHYGFPARHPQHLPDVIDEPSTFDYGPQHQSNCGLNFNEPVVAGGPVFGPQAWVDDVFLAGYSRGKLYRTQLVKSLVGYVARTQLLGCLKMLTVDACVGPAGEMVVACHSGGPDWGSGPTGKGKLFKIVYSDPEHPQVVLAWPAGPRELRVEFDRPVEPQLLREVLAQSKLTAGEFVRAGDRFESLWPGYAIVQGQKAAPRFDVPLRSAQLTPDRRTLVLATDPMTRASHFALMLPGMGRPMEGDDRRVSDAPGDTPLAATGSANATARDDASSRRRHKKALAAEPVAHTRAEDTLPQHASLDLDFDLSGCEATWTPADGGPVWTGWLPHFDLDVARRLTIGSAPHDELWSSMNRPGDLMLRAKLDLTDMLRPAVQPGAKIDYEFPPETVTVTFETAAPGAKLALRTSSSDGDDVEAGSRVKYTSEPDAKLLVPIELRMTSVEGPPKLVVSWITNEDDRPRPLPLRRIFVPWAEKGGEKSKINTDASIPELEGGSWARGYHEFFGEKAACSKCHTIHGRGGDIGPNLSNLMHRDYASVLRDITHPSFAINPDHLTYTAILGDGRVLSGVVRTSGDTTSIGDANGKIVEVAKGDIEELAPSGISTMPEGVAKALGEDRMRDLLTFLLMAPPQMPRDHAGPRPKPRPIAAVNAALAGAPDPAEKTRPIKLVLVAGPKDHGPGEHDYPAWQKAWTELFSAVKDVEVSTAWEWPAKQQFEEADVMVFYQHGDWTPERAADIDPYLKRGGGLVYIHWALDGRQMGREFAERIGLAALGGGGFRHGEIALKFNDEIEHPITRNYDTLMLHDETYWNLAGELPANRVLATAVEEGAVYPQLWTMEPHSGRVFVSIPGHYSWTFDDPLFRVLLLRGIAWAAKEPVDRFNELVWPGTEVAK